jgi:hypothetical protein
VLFFGDVVLLFANQKCIHYNHQVPDLAGSTTPGGWTNPDLTCMTLHKLDVLFFCESEKCLLDRKGYH